MRNSHSSVAMQRGGAGVGVADMDSGNLAGSVRTVTWAEVRILSVIYIVILVLFTENCFSLWGVQDGAFRRGSGEAGMFTSCIFVEEGDG